MTATSLSQMLRGERLLAELCDGHIQSLARCTECIELNDNEFVFRENEEARDVFVLRSGKIALEVHRPARGAIVLETLHSGEVFGWSAIAAPFRWQVDARAVRASQLFALDSARLTEAFDADPRLGYAFTRLLLGVTHKRLERTRMQCLDVYGGRR